MTGFIIFSEQEYEKKPPRLAITPSMVSNANLKRSITDSGFDGCRLKYKANSGELITASFFIKEPAIKILEINDRLENAQEAQKLVKTRLREKNKDEFRVSLELPGLSGLNASDCFELKDFGVFSGKYFTESVSRRFSPTSRTIEAYKVLNEY